MIKKPVKYILFDASGTLIHKPALWDKMLIVLQNHGFDVELDELKKKHKIISECIHFPDRTSKEFYLNFNAEVLFALGIVPEENLLEEIFNACTYLPWEKFDDTNFLLKSDIPIGVLSNFNSGLNDLLNRFFGDIFVDVLISEVLGVAKPKLEFYQKAENAIDCPAENILYVGDSMKLDIKPALQTGMNPLLIDRDNYFPSCPYRINSLTELSEIIL